MEIFKAHKQWSSRPKDERFKSLEELYYATKGYANNAKEATRPFSDLRVEAMDGEVQLVGRSGNPARLTHWAFGQLCSRLEAPASYLRDLPETLACQNLNHGLARRKAGLGVGKSDDAQLLFHQNGSLLLRAITSDSYTRIWNHEVALRLVDLQEQGWEPAVPDLRAFNGSEPALYASDHDMFAFLRNKNRTVKEAGKESEPMWRGWIVENSEVGAKALKLTRFLYRYMCGNHIIWGASHVCELNVRHVGEVHSRLAKFMVEMKQLDDRGANEEEAMIVKAQRTVIAMTKEEVLDKVFGMKKVGLSRKVLEAGYSATKEGEDGSPNTVWGLLQGITRHSQTIPYADQRQVVDKAAGKLLEVDF